MFALGSLKGSIYYNTYTSPQVANNGAVMRIQPGAATPTALLTIPGTSPVGPCISCHSLSADGSTLVAQRHQYPPGLVQSESYDLKNNGVPNPNSPLAKVINDDWGFSALYPDGSRLLTDGSPGQSGPILGAGTSARSRRSIHARPLARAARPGSTAAEAPARPANAGRPKAAPRPTRNARRRKTAARAVRFSASTATARRPSSSEAK